MYNLLAAQLRRTEEDYGADFLEGATAPKTGNRFFRVFATAAATSLYGWPRQCNISDGERCCTGPPPPPTDKAGEESGWEGTLHGVGGGRDPTHLPTRERIPSSLDCTAGRATGTYIEQMKIC